MSGIAENRSPDTYERARERAPLGNIFADTPTRGRPPLQPTRGESISVPANISIGGEPETRDEYLTRLADTINASLERDQVPKTIGNVLVIKMTQDLLRDKGKNESDYDNIIKQLKNKLFRLKTSTVTENTVLFDEVEIFELLSTIDKIKGGKRARRKRRKSSKKKGTKYCNRITRMFRFT
jgi:hypothetical protein